MVEQRTENPWSDSISADAGDTYKRPDSTPSNTPSNSSENPTPEAPPADLPDDPDLVRIIDAWPHLPEPIKLAVLALVRAGGQPGASRDR